MHTLTETLKLELENAQELKPKKALIKSVQLKHWKLTLLLSGIILLPFAIYLGGSVITVSLIWMAYAKVKYSFTPINIDKEYKDFIEELEQDWR